MKNKDYPPKSEPSKKESMKGGMNRRDFFRISAVTGAGLVFGLNPFDTKAQTEESNHAKNLEIKDPELNKIIKEYLEQETSLSREEVKKSLEKCGFIEDLENINIQELEVKSPQKNHADNDLLKEALESGEVELDKNKLNIIQTDFNIVGDYKSGAFYLYKCIFINQSRNTKEAKKEKIESFIYEKTIDLEYEKTRNLILNSGISVEKKDQKIKELNNWLIKTYEGSKNVEKIFELIERNLEEIKKSVEKFCAGEMVKKIITETNLPHEAFHYFLVTQLGKEGYEGPSIEELLIIAIKGKIKRFGKDNDSNYAPIDSFLDDGVANDPEKLLEFCRKVKDEKHFVKFLDEYLARIYNGAVGNTPSFVKKEIEENDYIESLGGSPLKLSFEEMYHEPTEEELLLLKNMKWNENSIIKN
jgi:hypothetical protein